MRKEHKCEKIKNLNIDHPYNIITVKNYEIGGWEVERQEHWDEPTSLDEIYFCPYCGAKLEKEENKNEYNQSQDTSDN